MEDTQKELERLERELLRDEEQEKTLNDAELDEELDEELLELLLKEEEPVPAFDTPETIHTPKEPMVYRNYSNDYGKKPDPREEKRRERQRRKDNKIILGLMITASVLCLGIVALLLYWLNVLS